VLRLVGIVLTLGVAVALAACGGTATTTTTGLQQQLANVESQPTANETPASFISLCANCHDSLDAPLKWRTQMKLVFNHPKHFAKGIRCEACHQEFPHKPGKTLHVPVQTCFVCHGSVHGPQGVMAPTSCDTCHTSDVAKVTPDHLVSTWVFVQGKTLAAHGEKGKVDPLFCKMCHQQSYCQDCHKVDIPHPADWVKSHPADATTERAACVMCHQNGEPGTPGSPAKLAAGVSTGTGDVQTTSQVASTSATPRAVSIAFCNDCHHKDFTKLPDWATQHKQVVLSGGAEPCFTCHQPPFCSACHVTVGKERGALGG
jgi:hypothetical protein